MFDWCILNVAFFVYCNWSKAFVIAFFFYSIVCVFGYVSTLSGIAVVYCMILQSLDVLQSSVLRLKCSIRANC